MGNFIITSDGRYTGPFIMQVDDPYRAANQPLVVYTPASWPYIWTNSIPRDPSTGLAWDCEATTAAGKGLVDGDGYRGNEIVDLRGPHNRQRFDSTAIASNKIRET